MTCAEKAKPGGCQLHNVHCGYPKCDQDPEPKPEMVHNPRHYNTHPSGVETIELARLMSFNMGNALKYVMRRDDKGTAKQDLQKALWYLKDERDHLFVSAAVMELSKAVVLIDRITSHEGHPQAKAFYAALSEFMKYHLYGCPTVPMLVPVISAVEALLQTYD